MHPTLAALWRSVNDPKSEEEMSNAAFEWGLAGYPGIRGLYNLSGVIDGCCIVHRCTGQPHARGLCRRHYAEAAQAGTLDLYPKVKA